MDKKRFLIKVEEVFINNGFEPAIINGVKFMRHKECYCKLTYIKDWSAFVIESADNIQDAEKGVLEDSDLYYTDVSENELLCKLESDLIRDYLDN
ncbi:MAG: hypothetical protein Q4F83_03050 [Eubacteriales bacterium]|nr:hypothetical protein [Eubacteriales bacterium]